MRTVFVLFAFLCLSTAASFGQIATETENERIERITKDEFKKNLESEEYIVFDVRTVEEYQAGHIKNAKSLNVNGKAFEATLEQLPKNYKYMIYCQSGGRSAKALQMMKDAGFIHVLELEGGYSKW